MTTPVVQYLVPVTHTVSGELLTTAHVTVEQHDNYVRELYRAGRAASLKAHEVFVGPGLTIHVGRAVRLG
jgi:hypothetical protein